MFVVVKNKVNDKVLEKMMNSPSFVIGTCQSTTGLESITSVFSSDEFLSCIDNFYTAIDDSTEPASSVGVIYCKKTMETDGYLYDEADYAMIWGTTWALDPSILSKYTQESIQGLLDIMLRAVIADKTTNRIICSVPSSYNNSLVTMMIIKSLTKYNFVLDKNLSTDLNDIYYRDHFYSIDGGFYS